MDRDLLSAEHYAKFCAVVFQERMAEKTPREFSQKFWAAGLDTLEFLPAAQTPSWSSPRYLPAGPYVEAWAAVKRPDGSPLGAVLIRRQAGAIVFMMKAIRAFAVAACITFALLLALAWFVFKRRVTDRLDAIVRDIGPLSNVPSTGPDAVERTGQAFAQKLAAAQKSEQRLRLFLDRHTELANISTPEGRLIDVNPAYCRFFGKKREELIGTNCLDLVPPADRMEVVRRLQAVAGTKRAAETEHALVSQDGSTSWFRWNTSAIPDPESGAEHIISFRSEITAQKLVEEQLEDLRRAFDQMQSLAQTGSLTWDLAHDRMEWTGETRRLFGADASVIPSLEKLLEIVAPEDCAVVRQLFEKARHEGLDFKHEFGVVLPDGTLRVLQSRAEVLSDPKTKLLTRLTCTLRDITPLRDAEASIKRELRFREAIEQSLAIGIVVSDEKGKNLLVNPAFCKMTGWTSQELTGIGAPYPYWPEEEIPAINTAFDHALRGETPKEGFELTFCRKDGTRFDALVKVAPLLDSDDHQLGWLGAVSDISAIQQTRRELARTGQQLRAQLDYMKTVEKSITVGLITIGADGRPVSVNDAYCQMMGYSREEIMAMAPPYPLWPEEDREEIQLAFDMHLQGKAPPGGFQLRFKKKDGSLVDVLITVSAIHGVDGTPSGILSSLTNISPLKDAERRLNAVNQRLQIAQDVAEFGIWEWDSVTDRLFWDRNSFAMFGHPKATDPKAVWSSALSEEEQERLTYELRQLIASGGQSGQDELRVPWPDRSVHEILSTYVIVPGEADQPTRVLGVYRDITTELEEEGELRNAQERLAAALEGGNFGTFEHLFGVGALHWNATNYEMHGIDPSIKDPDALFRAWKETIGEEYQAIEQKVASLPVQQSCVAYDYRIHVPRTGERRQIHSSVFVERDKQGHPVRLVGVSRRLA